MKIEYTKVGDYKLPNLTLDNKNNEGVNKYGLLRFIYLKENKKSLYTTLFMKNYLTKNKNNNQLEWIKLMNNYKNIAEESRKNRITNFNFNKIFDRRF